MTGTKSAVIVSGGRRKSRTGVVRRYYFHVVLAIAGIATAWGSALSANGIGCPAFPLPDAKLTWVAPDIAYNGVPMEIRKFDSDQNPQSILGFYRNQWRGTPERPGNIEYNLADWQVIAALRDRCFYTVQVRASAKGGANGMLGVSRVPEKSQVRQAGYGFPMMSGTRVINDIDHHDPGKTARTLLLRNEFSPDTNADFYRRTMGMDGWQVIAASAVPTGNRNAHVLTFRRRLDETTMSIARTGDSTSVLVNIVAQP